MSKSIAETLGEIPPDHPWFQAVVAVVEELRVESYGAVLAPPGNTNNDARNYDSGRVSMAEDVLGRLRRYQQERRARAG